MRFISGSYAICSFQHRALLLSPVTYTAGCCFHFGFVCSLFLELFLHFSPVAYWAPTDLVNSSLSIISFYVVHGVLKGRILKWLAIPFSSGPHFVKTLHHDPSVLDGLHSMAHSFIELIKAVIHVLSLVSFL